jgi:hypothetical protein
VYWREPLSRWVIVDLENQGAVHFADDIALVRLDEDADSDQVEQRALARDLEGDPLWLVDVHALGALGRIRRRAQSALA